MSLKNKNSSTYDSERGFALLQRAKYELKREFNSLVEIDFGDVFIDALFYGSLNSLAKRVENSGFCPTSYGESNGICCYGLTHYPRDTAEAATALAMNQMPHLGRKILDFSLDNIPVGQYYLPHVYRSDGSIKANTIQIDTPGHIARALLACVQNSKEVENSDLQKFENLVSIFQAIQKHHYHSEFQLFDGGNYNEQFDGGKEPLLDLFTNSAMLSGYHALVKLAKIFDKKQLETELVALANSLLVGIKCNLFDSTKGFYRSALKLNNHEFLTEDNWIVLYCQRWMPEAPQEVWQSAYRYLQKHTTLNWSERYKIVTGEHGPRNFMILGKVFAQQIGYFAEIQDKQNLKLHLEFLRETVRMPDNLYPEWWYHHYPKNLKGYYIDFLREHQNLWMPYDDNQNGDYTVDSGNCEQTAVFIQEMTKSASEIFKCFRT